MIELEVLNYLESVMDVPVFMEKPTENMQEFVLLEKTSSGQENHIQSATFAIQSWSDSMYEAALLNEAVKTAMLGDGKTSYGITASTDISRCALNSDYNYTDTTTKSYRYQAVFDLVF